jgi:hypothetical protein
VRLVTRRAQADPGLRARLDPGFWHPAYGAALARTRWPLAALGEFIAHITYGPIVTGRTPPAEGAHLPVVHQGQVGETGVDLRQAVRVPAGSPWDLPRARLQPGDLVLPRSGVASVGRNRVAVYLETQEAVVGSFVDLVRLAGLDPCYALVCLKSEIVWSQVHRLINGVGTPNISFEEIRSLQIPLAPAQEQARLAAAYREEVHSAHSRWLAGEDGALAEGRAALRDLAEGLLGPAG